MFLLGIVIGITSSAIGLKICTIVAGIKKYKSIIKKKKNNSLEVVISKTLIDSNINHDQFILIDNVQKKYDNIP